MPHLSPLIWTLLFISIWALLYLFTVSFEYFYPCSNSNVHNTS